MLVFVLIFLKVLSAYEDKKEPITCVPAEEISAVRSDMTSMKTEIDYLKSELVSMRNEMESFTREVKDLVRDVAVTRNQMHQSAVEKDPEQKLKDEQRYAI